MKLDGNYKEWVVSQTQLGKIIGVSQQRVGQLIDEGIAIRDESSKNGAVLLIESLKKYYLNKNTGGADAEVNYNVEKALYMKAKRELAELKLSKAKGELYNASEVESAFVNMLTILRNNLLGLPSKFATQLEGKERDEIYGILNSEIEYQLAQLAEFDLSKLTAEPENDEDEDY